MPVDISGTYASTLGQNNPICYRGYYYDSETGFYYLNSRYYDPAMRRFINADDTEYLGADGDFASFNLFVYCGNNPISRTDSNGCFWHIVAGAVTGAITGAAGSALKVGKAAKAWDSSSKGGSWTNMSDHYKKHVLKEGKKAMTKNVITYTNDALELWNNSNGMGKLMSSGSLKLKGVGVGGFYSMSGLIRSFFYQ